MWCCPCPCLHLWGKYHKGKFSVLCSSLDSPRQSLVQNETYCFEKWVLLSYASERKFLFCKHACWQSWCDARASSGREVRFSPAVPRSVCTVYTILVYWFVWRCECKYLEMDEFYNELNYYVKMYYDYYQVNLIDITIYYDYFLTLPVTLQIHLT